MNKPRLRWRNQQWFVYIGGDNPGFGELLWVGPFTTFKQAIKIAEYAAHPVGAEA